MKRVTVWGMVLVMLLAGCGGQTTPDTEGQTLAQARQSLLDAGVSNNNITVNGETQADENDVIVCDHDPDGVEPSQPVTLQVAQDCPDEDGKKKKKKKSGGSRKRR